LDWILSHLRISKVLHKLKLASSNNTNQNTATTKEMMLIKILSIKYPPLSKRDQLLLLFPDPTQRQQQVHRLITSFSQIVLLSQIKRSNSQNNKSKWFLLLPYEILTRTTNLLGSSMAIRIHFDHLHQIYLVTLRLSFNKQIVNIKVKYRYQVAQPIVDKLKENHLNTII